MNAEIDGGGIPLNFVNIHAIYALQRDIKIILPLCLACYFAWNKAIHVSCGGKAQGSTAWGDAPEFWEMDEKIVIPDASGLRWNFGGPPKYSIGALATRLQNVQVFMAGVYHLHLWNFETIQKFSTCNLEMFDVYIGIMESYKNFGEATYYSYLYYCRTSFWRRSKIPGGFWEKLP